MKLIIPMAGRGTRVRPHSHVTPKPLLPVKGRTAVERIVDTFNRVLQRDLDEGIFVLGPDFGAPIRQQLTDICERHGMRPHFPIQEKAEGTAHAVYCAGEHLEGEGIVVFADTVFDMEPGADLEEADVVAWIKYVDDPSRFGIAVREGERVVRLVEKPKEPESNEALIGIYYVKDLARLRKDIQGLIDDDVRGAGGEFQLTDAFDRMLQDGAVFHTESVTEWLDCGTIDALMDTTMHILDKESDDLHQGTVENSIIHDPVYIGPGAKVINSVVGPYVSIEQEAVVENAVVRNAILFAHSRTEHAVLADAMVGAHAEVLARPLSLNIGDHSAYGELKYIK